MSVAGTYDAILLIGFGGPEAPAQVRPFLDRVLQGRPTPPARIAEVVSHYEALGGRSPYNELTRLQAADLRQAFARRGLAMPVVVGFRNADPFIEDAVRMLAGDRYKRVLGFILSAFRSEASWDRYCDEIAAARAAIGADAPEVSYPTPWHRHRRFIRAAAAQTRAAIARLDDRDRGSAELIFTAHSIPIAMAAPYVEQLRDTAKMVAQAVGYENWRIAYQSRAGNPQEPWLEPDVRAAILSNPRPKIVIPLGFLCDHVEVLYDLDIETAATARNAGIRMERAATVGRHPEFIEMIAEIALGHESEEL
jgi:ferrochelatase